MKRLLIALLFAAVPALADEDPVHVISLCTKDRKLVGYEVTVTAPARFRIIIEASDCDHVI